MSRVHPSSILDAAPHDEAEEERRRRNGLKYFDFLITLAQLSGIAMMGLAGFVFGTSKGGLQWNSSNVTAPASNAGNFNFHGLLFTAALIFLQGEALLVFRYYRHEAKLVVNFLHTLLQSSALLLAVGGVLALVWQNELAGDVLLSSHHAWLGIAILVCQVLHAMIGAFTFIFPGCSGEVKRGMLPMQRRFGLGLFLANVGQLLSGTILYAQRTLGDCDGDQGRPQRVQCTKRLGFFLNLCALSCVIYAICVSVMMSRDEWRRKSSESDAKKKS